MNQLQCNYCGRVKETVSFVIGASLGSTKDGYEWTMWEGTGKVSCNSAQCYSKGSDESHYIIHELTKRR